MKTIDLTGQRFGRLLVMSRGANLGRRAGWLCQCDCGSTCSVSTMALRSARTRSCGCLRQDGPRAANTRHGHAAADRTRTYRSWRSMIDRCTNQNDRGWKYWGGRGVTITPRWLQFEGFLADMGERPEGMTLDRFPDRNGNYEPGNVRWATAKQQANNRRSAVIAKAVGT